MNVDPIAGPILGGLLLGLSVLFGGYIVIRLIRRSRARKRRLNDPELAKNAKEGHQVGAAPTVTNSLEKEKPVESPENKSVEEPPDGQPTEEETTA